MTLSLAAQPSGVLLPCRQPPLTLAGGVLAFAPLVAAGLVGYWPLTDGTGTTAGDLSGTTNPGTWGGTLGSQWGSGPLGGAGVFNGTNNSITIGDANRYPFERTQPFSVAAWVKTTSAGTITIFAKRLSTGVTPGYTVTVSAGKVRTLIVSSTTGNVYLDVSSVGTVNDGNWHHVGMAYAGTSLAAGVQHVIDGTPVGSTVTMNNLSASVLSTAVPQIGSGNNLTQFFSGSIAEVGLWACQVPASVFATLAVLGLGYRPV